MSPPQEQRLDVRVRYCETDAMGYLHHANFFTYFEMGRTELFRAQGGSYRQMEEDGMFMVVVHLDCKFRQPARFDDLLSLVTRLVKVTPAKLEHDYFLDRDDLLLAQAHSVLACVDKSGQVQRLPDVFHNILG